MGNNINKGKMNKYLKYILFIAILLLPTIKVIAQEAGYDFDVPAVEALIENHKTSRVLLNARATLETGNTALHSLVEESATSYYNINVNLDKYTRSFCLIDLLFNTLKTSLNATSTVKSVTSRISDYKNLMLEYNERVIKRGKWEKKDTIIFSIADNLISDVYKKTERLYTSLSDVGIFASGLSAASTSDLMLILENINSCLDNLNSSIDKAYLATWKYIRLRCSYWKESLNYTQSKEEVALGALSRWKSSATNALNTK